MTRAHTRKRARRRTMSVSLWAPLAAVVAFSHIALAAPGQLDHSFDYDGKLTTLMTPATMGKAAAAQSVAIQADGKIVVAGQVGGGNNDRFALARYNNVDGSLDLGFSGDGRAFTSFGQFSGARDVAIQADGKIVAVGWRSNGSSTRFAVARYHPNGQLDQSFDGDGMATTAIGASSDAESVAIQADGGIVVAGAALIGGNRRFALARYLPSGALDVSNFGTGNTPPGTVTTAIGAGASAEARSVAIQTDQSIVAAGFSSGVNTSHFALARYLPDGSLDTTFGVNGSPPGTVATSFGSSSSAGATSLAIQADGNIVAAGTRGSGSGSRFALARYLPDGTPDANGFGGGTGRLTTPMGPYAGAESIAIQGNGGIVVAGTSTQAGKAVFALARYLPTGDLDTTFGGNTGKVKTLIWHSAYGADVAIQPSDGRLVVAGQAVTGNHYRFALARYDD